MLVYYFGYITGSVEQVAAALTASAGEMSVWARLAYREGEELRARIGAGSGVPAKAIEIDMGEPLYRAGATTIPISWKATGVESLFPVMNADLVVEPMGADMVQVVLRGSYQPPLGGVGRLLDRALLHRLAQASAKSFLDQLCSAIEATIGQGAAAATLAAGPAPSGEDARSDRQDRPDGGPPTAPAADDGLAAGLLGPPAQV